jgi:hypothetical protein
LSQKDKEEKQIKRDEWQKHVTKKVTAWVLFIREKINDLAKDMPFAEKMSTLSKQFKELGQEEKKSYQDRVDQHKKKTE